MSKLVTFDQAKKLKELGYDKECLYFYHDSSINSLNPNGYTEYDIEVEELYVNYNKENILYQYPDNWHTKIIDETYSASTIHEALDWFREVEGVVCFVDVVFNPNKQKAFYIGKILSPSGIIIWKKTNEFDTHYEAESALLDALIEYVSK